MFHPSSSAICSAHSSSLGPASIHVHRSLWQVSHVPGISSIVESLWPPLLYLHSFTQWSLKTSLQGLGSCYTLPGFSCCLKPWNGTGLHDALSFMNLVFHATNPTPHGWHCQALLPSLDITWDAWSTVASASVLWAWESSLLSFHLWGTGNSLRCFLSPGFLFLCKFEFLWIGAFNKWVLSWSHILHCSSAECHLSSQWSCSTERV